MEKSKNNEYLKTMTPIFYLMKIICGLPFRIKPQNEIPHFVSSKLVYFVLMMACIIFHGKSGKHAIYLVISKKLMNIIVSVVKVPEIGLELFCLAVPLLMWNKHEEIQDYWDSWKRFQMKKEALTGVPYVSTKRKYIKVVALVCILWSIVRNIFAAAYFNVYTSIFSFITNIYLSLVIHIIITYWFANCAYFQSVSEDVIVLVKKIIIEKEDGSKVNELVSMWLTLNYLINQFNETHSLLFLSFFCLIVVSLITYSYALLYYSTYKVIYPLLVYIRVEVIFSGFLLLISEAAYSLHHQINFRQKEALLEGNMTKIEIATLKSILRFLQTICLHNQTIHLNGFFALNRATLLLVFSVCINYLIVLRQFSDVDQVSKNQTNVFNYTQVNTYL